MEMVSPSLITLPLRPPLHPLNSVRDSAAARTPAAIFLAHIILLPPVSSFGSRTLREL